MDNQFELHSHNFVSGPRATAHYEKGEWVETKFTHSHAGGSTPHTHPHTGPSFYRYRNSKFTPTPRGEHLELVAMSEEESTFHLVLTDSALIDGKIPVGDMPLEALGFPAAETMALGCRMKCIVRDERTHKPQEVA